MADWLSKCCDVKAHKTEGAFGEPYFTCTKCGETSAECVVKAILDSSGVWMSTGQG